MRILITSDTHTGFDNKTDHIHRTRMFPAMKEQAPELVIHAGDWGIRRKENVFKAFRDFRKNFPDIPIIGVLGNHDYWQYGTLKKDHQSLIAQINTEALDNGITLLNGFEAYFGKIVVFGFPGWYGSEPLCSNDPYNMYKWVDSDSLLRQQSRECFEDAVVFARDSSFSPKICVTHFPPYSMDPQWGGFCANQMYFDPLCEKFNYLIVGHSHQREDFFHKGCRVINPGSDYNKPKFVVLDLI